MSIGLYISYQNPAKEDRLLPIASDTIFEQYWKPLCMELRLRWVSRFQNGWTLAEHDIAPILQELAHIRRHLVEDEPEAEITHHILARISVLMRELNEVGKGVDTHAFIGGAGPVQRRVGTSPAERRSMQTNMTLFRTNPARRHILPFL